MDKSGYVVAFLLCLPCLTLETILILNFVLFSSDAYCTLLSIIGKVKGESTRQAIVGGCAIKQNGTVVPTYKTGGLTYAPISEGFAKAMFEEDKSEKTYIETKPGMVLSLVGRAAFPCVCEVPPSCAPLFSEAGAKVVSQGITWQSLYLVILGWNLVLAEPERKYVDHNFVRLFYSLCIFLLTSLLLLL
jgi:hypothetical protein